MTGERPKTKTYIDGANMFYAQKRFGWSFDWKKIKEHLEAQKDIAEKTKFKENKKPTRLLPSGSVKLI